MSRALSNFAAQHWVLGGIAASLLWFIGAKAGRKPEIAMIVVAVLIALIMCGWAVAGREWLGLVGGIVVIYVEVRTIRRTLAARGSEV